MLDHLIKGGTVVDGTGAPGFTGRRRRPRRPDRRRRRRSTSRRAETIDADRPGRHARASSTRTRTTTPSCSGTRTRRRRTCTASRPSSAATAASRSRRSRPDDADYTPPDDGQGRGHAARRARGGRRLELADLRRVPRPARRQHRRQRRVPRRPLRAAPLRDGRRRGRQRGDARAARRDGRSCCTSRSTPAGSGFSTTLSSHALRRRRPAGRVALGDATTSCSRCARAVGEHEGTTLEAIVRRLPRPVQRRRDRAASSQMSAAARPPAQLERAHRRLARARAGTAPARGVRRAPPRRGGRVVALTMPMLVADEHELPQLLRAVHASRAGATSSACRCPSASRSCATPRPARGCSSSAAAPEAGVFRRLADFGHYVIGDTYSAANEGLKGRIVGRHRRRAGHGAVRHAASTSCVADDLRTVLWPIPPDDDAASWELRQRCGTTRGRMLGGSDAGAHLDRMCGAPYTTRFLGDMLRGRKLVSLEQAVQLITDAPGPAVRAARPGPARRGLPRRPRASSTPRRSAPSTPRSSHDLPGGTARLTARVRRRRAASSSTAWRPSSTARPPAPSPARSSAPAATPRP